MSNRKEDEIYFTGVKTITDRFVDALSEINKPAEEILMEGDKHWNNIGEWDEESSYRPEDDADKSRDGDNNDL